MSRTRDCETLGRDPRAAGDSEIGFNARMLPLARSCEGLSRFYTSGSMPYIRRQMYSKSLNLVNDLFIVLSIVIDFFVLFLDFLLFRIILFPVLLFHILLPPISPTVLPLLPLPHNPRTASALPLHPPLRHPSRIRLIIPTSNPVVTIPHSPIIRQPTADNPKSFKPSTRIIDSQRYRPTPPRIPERIHH
ncbi:hypothetical protein CONLIGDRAFT_688972, partial [Coniochaeta ligniaria NRRL 30616]